MTPGTPPTEDPKHRRRRKIWMNKDWLKDPCPHCDKRLADYVVPMTSRLLNDRNIDILKKFVPTLFRFDGNVTKALREVADDIAYTSVHTVRKAIFPWLVAHDIPKPKPIVKPVAAKPPPVAAAPAAPANEKVADEDLVCLQDLAASLERTVNSLTEEVGGLRSDLAEQAATLSEVQTLANRNASKISHLQTVLNTHQHQNGGKRNRKHI